MKSYPAESSAEIRENLAQRFDQFLRAAAREIKEKMP
jgi:hypothetical protein